MITNQDLEAKGYRKHPPSKIVHPYSDYFYQKKFTNDVGTKYFIEMVHYAKSENHQPLDESWTMSMTINDPHCRFEQFRVEDLAKAESNCGLVWIMMGEPYHSKYGEP